ncbi:heparinase II/III family protein [Hungatella effluvii]|uniref:heparinase II/III family protein n=1 Tax=Hungatella effluvii TaxID=1096246 RepID=UPI000D76A961|nr:heparinase II/III family protein [Hungatella effluvii]
MGYGPDFTWQFNRHRFLICLGQAYLMTGNEMYAACMLDLVQQFIRSQSDVQEKRQTTWRLSKTTVKIRGDMR